MKVLVTGAKGFIGKNLVACLERQNELSVIQFDLDTPPTVLEEGLKTAELIFHLAGVNRPQSEDEFTIGNTAFTAQICERLQSLKRAVPIVFPSSIQALQDNPYGRSKRRAEEILQVYAETVRVPVFIYRLKNVFGKWCRPNYNSVVATFCHNIAHDLPITVSDAAREMEFIYVDDVVRCFSRHLQPKSSAGVPYYEVEPVYKITLGQLAALISVFRRMRTSLLIPDFDDDLTRKLYGTYLTYLEPDNFSYALDKKRDDRGCLAEFAKSPAGGQIFLSRTSPGVVRGNHYHYTKTEKFLVVEGEAIIRFRHIIGGKVIEYRVRGDEMTVVDIPPGYTHSIENVGSKDLVTLFWSSELFNPDQQDTFGLPVIEA